ncbi:MAG: complex I NDUFA9 subunit family protein [Gammaproteobacteria bacterium]
MRLRKICILGGSGFVGRHIAHTLIEQGYVVRIPTRRRERHRDLLVLPTLELIEADIHNPQTLAGLFKGCDAVINLAGILNEKGHDGSGFDFTHVQLPHKVVKACAASGIKRLLHMSALNADATHGPSHYLRSKGRGEDLVHNAPGLRVTSFRPSVIFGPEDSFFNRFAKLLKITPVFFPLACPNARFAPVYVDDVAQAFCRALTEPASYGMRYDLCGPRVYTLRQLVEYTAHIIGVKRFILELSDRTSRLQARVFEYLPGKLFSMDNYRSLQKDSVCRGAVPLPFDLTPTPLEAVVPIYLAEQRSKTRYFDYRRAAGRR